MLIMDANNVHFYIVLIIIIIIIIIIICEFIRRTMSAAG